MSARRRLTTSIAASVIAVSMVPGIASAIPNPESAVGACGGTFTIGLGGRIAQEFFPNLRELAETEGNSLGQQIQASNSKDDGEQGFAIPLACAPKKGQA